MVVVCKGDLRHFDRLLVDIRTEYFLNNVVIGFLQFLVELLLELVFEG